MSYLSSNNNNQPNFDPKDDWINKLKNRIFELEQSQKNYQTLNNDHNTLKRSLDHIADEKWRTEYETKQAIDTKNKQILELRADNENLQLIWTDKVTINKQLYSDNETLLKEMELANIEIDKWNRKWYDAVSQIEAWKNEKTLNDKTNNDWIEHNNLQKSQIEKLFEDNKKWNGVCKEQDSVITQYEEDKNNLVSKIEEINYEVNNIKDKIRAKDENVMFLQNQADELQQVINNYEIKINQWDKLNQGWKIENESINESWAKEKNKTNQLQSNNQQIQQCLNDREKEIAQLRGDNDNWNKTVRMAKQDNTCLNEDIKKKAVEIEALRDNAKRWVEEIKKIVEGDLKIRDLWQRKERINGIIQRNKNNIERSLNSFNSNSSNYSTCNYVNQSHIIHRATHSALSQSPQMGLNSSI